MLDGVNYPDEFKHKLLLAINNLIGMTKLVFHSIKDKYSSSLSTVELTVGSELTLYFNMDVNKRIGVRFIEKAV